MTKGRFCVFDKKRLQCMHNATIYSRWRDGKKAVTVSYYSKLFNQLKQELQIFCFFISLEKEKN